MPNLTLTEAKKLINEWNRYKDWPNERIPSLIEAAQIVAREEKAKIDAQIVATFEESLQIHTINGILYYRFDDLFNGEIKQKILGDSIS